MLRFNVIVAVCENLGIGLKGDLPWNLKSELKYFNNTTRRLKNVSKRNVVIMGRRTYMGIPENKRPLPGRLNVVLTTTLLPNDLPPDVMCCSDLEAAMNKLDQSDIRDQIENIWIVGGSGVYKEAMSSKRCHRLYITRINAPFECDTFFPQIPDDFKEVQLDPETPPGIQEENNIHFEYKIYEKLS